VKRAVVVAGCLLVGLAAGAILTLLQSDRYRADARVLVRPQSSRILPAVEALAESSLVESNLAQTLHLASPPNVAATSGKGGVLTVSVEEGSRERARQVDAEAVVILAQKVLQRFGSAGVSATVLDPAHVAEQTSPTPGRNLLITGLAGLIAGLALAAAPSTGRAARATSPIDPNVEPRLQARIDQVAKRERALAQRAGQLAAREQDLGRREGELERRVSTVDEREEELVAAAAAPQPEPEPEPEPAPSLREPAPARSAGPWTLEALEALTRERSSGASPEQQDEWSTYLFLLREHADADGTLPASFDQFVNDIFGPLPQPDE
jgi:hypothetical protein